MAILTPKILGPDGVLREDLAFSTTRGSRFFTGTIDADTVDMEVSINGAGWTNDSDLIVFEDTEWMVPNPAAYPAGLELLAGPNTLQVRAISLSGSTSAPATANVTLVQESDLGVVAEPPTNISVTQKDGSVELSVEGLTDATGFQGFNFYASKYEGGGDSGYQQINLETVADSTTTEEFETLATLEVESTIVVDGNGDPLADPLFFHITGTQEDEDEIVLQTDIDEKYEIPETARELRTTMTLESVRTIPIYSFDHNRLAGPTSDPATISIGEFAATPQEDPLYYVITSVFYDETNNLELESSFSQEVVGHPLRVTTTIGTFPVVSRQQIVRDYATSVFRSNPQIRVEEGSSLREVTIDPFSSEAERLRFIIDFLHRARSPSLLIIIDDPQGTGQSAPVATSSYKMALKQAFRLLSDEETQALIDAAFEAYASNFGVFRRTGRASQGEVTFYTTQRPTRTIPLPLGTISSGGSRQFRTSRAASLPLNQIASYYNPVTGRYQVTVPVRATTTGSAGNVGAGQVRKVVSAVAGISVFNSAAMFGGEDRETNLQLIERARRRLASVDSGTKQGYLQTAADVPGVIKANVVGGGDPLMQRDLDSSGVHRGGKVDIWIQGTNLATVTDVFAFSFQIGQDIQFEILGSVTDLNFVAVDVDLSTDNPIVEMLDYPDAGYEFKNASTGEVFDLTGVVITGYNTIRLDNTIPQPAVDLTDVVLGSYRRRVGNIFILPRQPVTEITDVTGVVSGQLPSTAFDLVHPDPPLEKGRSDLASDYLLISSYTDANGNTIPSGDLIDVEDEPHVLLGEYPEYLDSLGAIFLTVEVWDATKTTQYRGPDDPSGISDFTIILGDQTTPLAIQRVPTGNIASGATVLVSYSHDENFSVTYTTNLVVSVTQDAVNSKRHATADVIVKDAVPVPLDLQGTIVLKKGAKQETVDPNLRTNLTNYITNLRLGDPIRQSDVIDVIEKTTDVSYVVVPLTKMVRGEGSQVVRETLVTDLSSEVVQLPSLSTGSVLVWLIEDALDAATTNGGGSETDFRGVFEDDIEMSLLAASSQLSALGLADNQAYIIGNDGTVINGYSDDATLAAQGYDTPTKRQAERERITANRVLVSTITSDSPVEHAYAVTYIVGEDSGAKNIDPGAAEYITTPTNINDWLFTYDEDSA
jgi:hypothetical protein